MRSFSCKRLDLNAFRAIFKYLLALGPYWFHDAECTKHI